MAERVGVIGAGLAGLAAALDLTHAGCQVTVFERSRLLGGRATSFKVAGHEVDNGQHVFLACCTEFIDFVKRLGMEHALRLQDRFDVLMLSRRGKASRLRTSGLPAPWHLLTAFLGYRHMGWGAKLDVARALACVRETRRFDGTFAEWLARLGQRETAVTAFWQPFLVPALNAPLDQMRASDAAFVLLTAFLEDAGAARLGYCTVPLARIAEAAAQRVDQVRLATPVAGVEVRADGRVAVRLAGGEREVLDAVVVAVPPPQLASLLVRAESYGVPPLDGYRPHPIVDVHLWHDRGALRFDLAALLDSPVQWVFEKAPGYLCCSLSAADGFIHRSTEDAVRVCWEEVRATVPGLRDARLVEAHVTRHPNATFIARPGVQRPGPGTRFPRLSIAGSWTDTGWPDTLESAVRSGRAAARHLLDAPVVQCLTS